MSVKKPIEVLVVSPDRALAAAACAALEASPRRAFAVRPVRSLYDLPAALEPAPHALLLDLAQAELRGMDALRATRELATNVPIVAWVDPQRPVEELEALRHGAQEVLERGGPLPEALERVILRAMSRMEALRPLLDRSLRDEATGLPNRALFLDRLGMAMRRALRAERGCAVAILQLHGVDEVQGRYGHLPADMLIRAAAARLRDQPEGPETVGRFQRDEFGLIFEGLADPASAAERLREVVVELERPFRLATPREGIVQAALRVHRGLAGFPYEARTAGRLLALADGALFTSVMGAARGGG